MVYIRGVREDYDHWRELGNPGWSYDEVLPYFLRAENQERGPSHFHGTGGPLNVADLRYVSPLSTAFVEGCARIGIAQTEDFNGASQLGAGLFQVTQRNGRRCSAAEAYLHPIRHRANLTVAVNACVARILTRGGRAIAVEFISEMQLQPPKHHQKSSLPPGPSALLIC
jgi:choline dehydrogenase-like flavoprotein